VHSHKRCAALTCCPPIQSNKGGAHHHSSASVLDTAAMSTRRAHDLRALPHEATQRCG
jgi:hypothetical protein